MTQPEEKKESPFQRRFSSQRHSLERGNKNDCFGPLESSWDPPSQQKAWKTKLLQNVANKWSLQQGLFFGSQTGKKKVAERNQVLCFGFRFLQRSPS